MIPEIRIGLGHDTHRLDAGGPLRLGGVDIPFEKHAVGHSDADALLHAITDAVLGAAGHEELGQMFPDNDPANRGKDSAQMLVAAYELVRAQGWELVNLDCVVHAERPKILPHKPAIIDRIASVLGVDPHRISLKGKTGERVGEVGRGEIIQTMCVCLLSRS